MHDDLRDLTRQLPNLFATDFLGALLLAHRIGREARARHAELTAQGQPTDGLRDFLGFGGYSP